MAYRIMIVDDEALIRQLLTYQLSGAGYTVTSYGQGQPALERLLLDQPDLVLLDVMLPDMSGWEVCHQIRQFSSVPIVMLTAKSADLDIVTGLKTGADDYIAKPYSLVQLLARIEAVLRRSRSSEPAPAMTPAHGVAVLAGGHGPSAVVANAASVRYAPLPRYSPERAPQPSPITPAPQPTPTPAAEPPEHTPKPIHPVPNPLTYATLGRRLAETRRALGLSLYDAERESGVRWEFLQALERGHFSYIPGPELRGVLHRYSSYLGIDLRELVRASDPGYAPQLASASSAAISPALVMMLILVLVIMMSWLLLNMVQ